MEHAVPETVLAVMAHPDDEAFGPAGTLWLLSAMGVEVTLATATRGEAGRRRGSPPFCSPAELGQVRWRELEDSCCILGLLPPVYLGLPDKGVARFGPHHLAGMRQLMGELKPAVVLTLGPEGGLSAHSDHRAVSRLAREAWLALAAADRPGLCYYQRSVNPESVRTAHGLMPTHAVVEISAEARRARLAALRAHRSQTQQVSSLWEADEVVLGRLPRQEHFMLVEPGLSGAPPVRGGPEVLLRGATRPRRGSRPARG